MDTVKRFLIFVNNLIHDGSSTNVGLTVEDIILLKRISANFQNLLSFENVREKMSQETLRNTFCKDLFNVERINQKDVRYGVLSQKFSKIRKLKDHEQVVIMEDQSLKDYSIEQCYVKKEGNTLYRNIQLKPLPAVSDAIFYNSESIPSKLFSIFYDMLLYKQDPQSLLRTAKSQTQKQRAEVIQKLFDESKDDPLLTNAQILHTEEKFPFFSKGFQTQTDPQIIDYYGLEKSAVKRYSQYALPYKNFFSQQHFLLLDKDGRKIDLNAYKNFIPLITNLRNFTAHNFPMKFNTDVMWGGQIAYLSDGTTAVYSDVWAHHFYKAMTNNMDVYKNNHYHIYLPRKNAPITNEMELFAYLKKCSLVHVTGDAKNVQEDMQVYIQKYLTDFANSNPNDDLKKYIEEKMVNDGLSGKVKISHLDNPEMLCTRICQTPKFFNWCGSNKELIASQRSVIETFVNDIYGLSIMNYKNLLDNGKYMNIPINHNVFAKFIDDELNSLQKLCLEDSGSKIKITNNWSLFKPEQSICASIFCTYAHLVYNGFYESIRDFDARFMDRKKFDVQLQQKLRTKLSIIKMNVFTMRMVDYRDKISEQPIKSTSDKVLIIRAIRNAILHGNIRVRFNKGTDCDKNELFFICYPEDKHVKYYEIRVTVENLYNFFMQPLFADFERKEMQSITLMENESIVDMIKKYHPNYKQQKQIDEPSTI